jgi:deazaflavin-dependent oxidoreductase (nitroreductase family)
MPLDFQQQVIAEFRANAGRVGGPFEGARLLLLTTTGAQSGTPHTVPLGYLPDGGEQVLVIGSAGGSPRRPAWFHNILADPHVTVEDGVFVSDALAVVLEGADRDRAFARAVETDPGWARYEEQSGRALPVVALRPAPGPRRYADGPGGTAAGFVLPAPLLDGAPVELTRSTSTAPAAAAAAERVLAALGRRAEWVGDAPGLVSGRMLAALVNEACFALGEGIGSAADIDLGMELGLNHSRGPLAWGDLAGPEAILATLGGLWEEHREERYRPAPALLAAVRADVGLHAISAT